MKWLDKLKEYAPDIAGAVLSGGATLPSLALKAVSDVIGKNIDTEDGLSAFVSSASPETMLKIKQANNSFKIRMRGLDVELESAELKNQEHAREQHKDNYMPTIICCFMTISISCFGIALLVVTIPEDNMRLVDTLFGSYLTAWFASITYWTGTTRSSHDKTKLFSAKK